jgi:hypothetical protein
MKMRWAAYTSLSQDTHFTGGEGSQEFMGAVCYQRSGCPALDVGTSRSEPLSYLLGLWAVESPLLGYNNV